MADNALLSKLLGSAQASTSDPAPNNALAALLRGQPGLNKLAQSNPSFAQTVQNQYPWMKNVDYNIRDSRQQGDPTGSKRYLEFYPPDERDNPQPGKPTVEVFSNEMGPSDVMGEILSHHLPSVDPVIAAYRKALIGQMTPDQKRGIQGDYEMNKRNRLVDKGDDLNAWLQKQGGDSFFRGMPTGQWKKEEYTPTQQQIYEQMFQYLNKE